MSVEIKYDQNRKMLDIAVSGILEIDELTSVFETITNSSDYPPDIKAIWDLRKADFSFADYQFANELAKIRSRFTRRGSCPSAIIVSSNFQYGLSRMFEMLLEGKMPHQLMVFRDYKEGQKWLLEKH